MKQLNSRWLSRDLENSDEWIFHLDQKSASFVKEWVKDYLEKEKPLFELEKDDFQIKSALNVVICAVKHAMWGSGIALIKGFPRQSLTESEFRMMIWTLGLQFGVPRPQGKSTRYLSEVSNQGTNYRKADGRGILRTQNLIFTLIVVILHASIRQNQEVRVFSPAAILFGKSSKKKARI